MALFLGILRSGAAAAPLNPAYTEDEYRRYLGDLRPAALVLFGSVGGAARDAAAQLGVRKYEARGGTAAGVDLEEVEGECTQIRFPQSLPGRGTRPASARTARGLSERR